MVMAEVPYRLVLPPAGIASDEACSTDKIDAKGS
jgi:hypothetical protein